MPAILRAPRRQVERARAGRFEMELPEVLLWQQLRSRPGGFKFRRQCPLRVYYLDFACLEVRLAIEVDGEAHGCGDRPERDAFRDAVLADAGFQTLRIPAAEILRDLDAVLRHIVVACRARLPLHHRPLAGGPPPRSGEEFEG